MTTEIDRRMLLQAGAVVVANATSVRAQHAPAKLSTHALDMYLGKQAAGMRIDFSRTSHWPEHRRQRLVLRVRRQLV